MGEHNTQKTQKHRTHKKIAKRTQQGNKHKTT